MTKTNYTILLSFFIASISSCNDNKVQGGGGHTCKMQDCDKLDNTSFKSDYDKGSDGYLFDLTHYNCPSWSYEKCEEFVFSSGIPLTTGK